MPEERHIGPYRVLDTLGHGGNAKVYRAVREGDETEIALKVRGGKPSAEPYRRFKQEIETLQRIGKFVGVLPVLEACIPDSPSRDDPAWLAMPIASPINEVLAPASVEEIVRAMAAIADTLARLEEEHNLGHRDIKPQNLYALASAWLIGDFGLVDVPDGDNLTASGKPVGSRYYTPWEMIASPATAASHPADVYALGKTLWVLATGQTFPPEGPQPAGSLPGMAIDDVRPHPHALHLERLIERMTLRDPEVRPTKRGVAEELVAWLELPVPVPGRDVSEIRAKIRKKLSDEISAGELKERYRDAYIKVWKRFEGRFDETINQMLRDAHPRPDLNDINDKLTMNTMRTTHGFEKDWIKQLYRTSSISAGDPAIRYALRVGRGVEVFEDGELRIHGYVDVGYPETSGDDGYWTMETISVPVESIGIEAAIEEAIDWLVEHTARGLESFAANAPTRR